jgi:hypothetical protein
MHSLLAGWVVVVLGIPALASVDTLPLQSRTPPAKKESSSLVSSKAQAPEDALMPGAPRLGGVDTYGSSRINEVVLRELLGKKLDTWIQKGLKSDPSAVDLESESLELVKKKFGFAFAEWSILQYFEPGELVLYLTLDVVEESDVARRMPFLPAPSEELKDPGGLLKLWADYEEEALKLVEAGTLEPDTEKCPALHCPFGHRLPSLRKFEKPLVEGAAKQGAALLDILQREKRPERRAAAAYVLAYWVSQKEKVVNALVDRVRDPDSYVRNNALRVLGDIAQSHPEVLMPLAPILPALDYPRVSDRSKALYLVYVLSLHSSQVRETLLQNSVPALVTLMESKQPDHRELAHQILRKVSGKEYAPTDARAWLAWYRKLPKELTKK